MKIHDRTGKRVLKSVTLFLTPKEAAELSDSAADLAKNPQKHHHHISSEDYSSEVTIAVYTPENISKFDEESQKVLKDS
jgi:hypothetical protein